MAPDLLSPLAVVCHDAGACNVILPWLRRPDLSLRPVMDGPAAGLFRTRLGEAASTGHGTELDAALDGAAMLLSGTGWASDLEHRARQKARVRGIFSVAVIDHWVNYPMRFERRGETVWPDEFWVTDTRATEIAEQSFPGAVVRCFDNLYLRAEAAAVAPLPPPSGQPDEPPQVLYVLEPMRTDWGRGVPGEFQALDHFMRTRVAAGVPANAPIHLRPHPSDPTGKYDAWLASQRRRANVALDRQATLAGAIGVSTWVVGCESFALVIALAAGRRVFTSLPPWAPACRLPQPGIVRLRASEAMGV